MANQRYCIKDVTPFHSSCKLLLLELLINSLLAKTKGKCTVVHSGIGLWPTKGLIQMDLLPKIFEKEENKLKSLKVRK